MTLCGSAGCGVGRRRGAAGCQVIGCRLPKVISGSPDSGGPSTRASSSMSSHHPPPWTRGRPVRPPVPTRSGCPERGCTSRMPIDGGRGFGMDTVTAGRGCTRDTCGLPAGASLCPATGITHSPAVGFCSRRSTSVHPSSARRDISIGRPIGCRTTRCCCTCLSVRAAAISISVTTTHRFTASGTSCPLTSSTCSTADSHRCTCTTNITIGGTGSTIAVGSAIGITTTRGTNTTDRRPRFIDKSSAPKSTDASAGPRRSL